MKEEENKSQKFVTFNVDFTEYKTRLSTKFLKRKPYKAPDPKMILSFIPGSIKKIYIKEGDKVKKGDKLLILEAMKMRNEIMALCDGTVKTIHVKIDEIVANKQLLVELK